jgi:hypothetical protein
VNQLISESVNGPDATDFFNRISWTADVRPFEP